MTEICYPTFESKTSASHSGLVKLIASVVSSFCLNPIPDNVACSIHDVCLDGNEMLTANVGNNQTQRKRKKLVKPTVPLKRRKSIPLKLRKEKQPGQIKRKIMECKIKKEKRAKTYLDSRIKTGYAPRVKNKKKIAELKAKLAIFKERLEWERRQETLLYVLGVNEGSQGISPLRGIRGERWRLKNQIDADSRTMFYAEGYLNDFLQSRERAIQKCNWPLPRTKAQHKARVFFAKKDVIETQRRLDKLKSKENSIQSEIDDYGTLDETKKGEDLKKQLAEMKEGITRDSNKLELLKKPVQDLKSFKRQRRSIDEKRSYAWLHPFTKIEDMIKRKVRLLNARKNCKDTEERYDQLDENTFTGTEAVDADNTVIKPQYPINKEELKRQLAIDTEELESANGQLKIDEQAVDAAKKEIRKLEEKQDAVVYEERRFSAGFFQKRCELLKKKKTAERKYRRTKDRVDRLNVIKNYTQAEIEQTEKMIELKENTAIVEGKVKTTSDKLEHKKAFEHAPYNTVENEETKSQEARLEIKEANKHMLNNKKHSIKSEIATQTENAAYEKLSFLKSYEVFIQRKIPGAGVRVRSTDGCSVPLNGVVSLVRSNDKGNCMCCHQSIQFPVDDDRRIVTLECGHQIHVGCVINAAKENSYESFPSHGCKTILYKDDDWEMEDTAIPEDLFLNEPPQLKTARQEVNKLFDNCQDDGSADEGDDPDGSSDGSTDEGDGYDSET